MFTFITESCPPPPRTERRQEHSDSRASISGNRAFRFGCERCRRTRGETSWRKFGFTLAEVLITLGIIGVVAALTIPTLIANFQKQQTVNTLKKSYSTLQEAIKLSAIKNGEIEYWDYTLSAKDFVERYLSEFITINSGSISNSKIQYKYLNGSLCDEIWCTGNSHTITLANGSNISVSNFQGFNNGKVTTIDINGRKEPNTIGKDVFAFVIHHKYGLIPFGAKDFGINYQNFGEYNRNTITGSKDFACKKGGYGVWCSALILIDGWQISDDYPWK